MKDLPFTVEVLIKELDESIPERCPSPDQSEREIWMYAGKRDLVRSLVKRLEDSSNP